MDKKERENERFCITTDQQTDQLEIINENKKRQKQRLQLIFYPVSKTLMHYTKYESLSSQSSFTRIKLQKESLSHCTFPPAQTTSHCKLKEQFSSL